jgi:hypothetical protein
LLASDQQRRCLGERGRQRVQEHFTFAAQAEQYQRLFARLRPAGKVASCPA